ncbi:hypothetical protein Tco_0093587 [Tanacetum coccineum]
MHHPISISSFTDPPSPIASSSNGFTSLLKILEADFFPSYGLRNTYSFFSRPRRRPTSTTIVATATATEHHHIAFVVAPGISWKITQDFGRLVITKSFQIQIGSPACQIPCIALAESLLKGSVGSSHEESLNVTFDESPPPTKLSPLVDDDVGEEEAIRKNTKIVNTNNEEDESIEVEEIVNIKESKNHPLDQVIGNLNQRTLRSQAQNHSNFFCFISIIEPKNVNEALKDESWVVAMQEELNQFVANDVWD